MYPEQVTNDRLRQVFQLLGMAEEWDNVQKIEITPEAVTITVWDKAAQERVPTASGMATTTHRVRIV